eukprot:2367928-Rhodomonas_salina.3
MSDATTRFPAAPFNAMSSTKHTGMVLPGSRSLRRRTHGSVAYPPTAIHTNLGHDPTAAITVDLGNSD